MKPVAADQPRRRSHRRRARAAQAPGRLTLDELVHRGGTSGTTLGERAGGAHQARLLQLAPEVRRLVGHAADRLEHAPRLRHGEALREQPDRDVRPPELAAQALDGVDDDARVVEAERRERVDRLPPRARLVRPQHRRVDEREVRDRRDPAARVALRVAVRLQLLEVDGADAGLLGELALGGLLGPLARAHEAAREHPRPRERRLGALHEQDVEPPRQRGEHDRDGVDARRSRKPRRVDGGHAGGAAGVCTWWHRD